MTAKPGDGLRPELFKRVDESDDSLFYEIPRLVTHIDEPACAALAAYYRELLPAGGAVLDLMSSCVSHLPGDVSYRTVAGLGMNQVELDANPQLTETVVADLNRAPALPYDDGVFDGCVLSVSVQYLIKPVEVFAEVARVLKPGAGFAVTYSNRMFPTKAVAAWRALGDHDRARLIAAYMDAAGGFAAPIFADLSPAPGRSDPLFAVTAIRSGAE